MNIITATAVRDHFNATPDTLKGLSDAAKATVVRVDGKSPRGRIHPEAIAAFNKGRRGMHRYTPGKQTAANVKAKGERAELRARAVAAGHKVGARGAISRSVLDSLGE